MMRPQPDPGLRRDRGGMVKRHRWSSYIFFIISFILARSSLVMARTVPFAIFAHSPFGHTHTGVEAGLHGAVVHPGLGHATAGLPAARQFGHFWRGRRRLGACQAQCDEQRGMKDGVLVRVHGDLLSGVFSYDLTSLP
jgi:hypothetical protein